MDWEIYLRELTITLSSSGFKVKKCRNSLEILLLKFHVNNYFKNTSEMYIYTENNIKK